MLFASKISDEDAVESSIPDEGFSDPKSSKFELNFEYFKFFKSIFDRAQSLLSQGHSGATSALHHAKNDN